MGLGPISNVLESCLMIVSFLVSTILVAFYSVRHSRLKSEDAEVKKVIATVLAYCGVVIVFESHMTFKLGISLVVFLWKNFDGVKIFAICILSFFLNLAYVAFILSTLCQFVSFYPGALKRMRRMLVITPIYITIFPVLMFELCHFLSKEQTLLSVYFDSYLWDVVLFVTGISITLILYSWRSDRIRLTWEIIDKKYSDNCS